MELFKLLGTIAVENDTANKAIDDTTSKASDAEGKLSTAFSNIGSFAVKAGQVIASGLAVGAAAIGALTKQSVSQYAEYEQLIGGVETLFGESASTVQWYALNAYRTAGMNANDYMSTVTSFSASLLQSLGNDTEAATKYADMAITDMSDNANKMGTDMSMIQNAYQGFAKQNYTMLDNLKLGYGGTKEEMERLIQDADKLSDTFSVSKDKNGDLVYSYADIVDAIHIVQTEMGITGTTVDEASGTISGSVASMKASWQNLVGALSNGEADLGYFIDNFCETAVTAIHNLVPRIGQALSGISEVIAQLMPVIAAELPDLMGELLPGVISGATALITGLIVALPGILQIFLEQVPFIVSQLGSALVTAFPLLLETVQGLFVQLWDYIAIELLGAEEDFETTFSNISNFFTTTFAPIIEDIGNVFNNVKEKIQPLIEKVEEYVASGELAEDITNGIKTACEFLVTAYENVVTAAIAVSDWCIEHQTTLQNIAIVIGSVATALGIMKISMMLTNAITTIATATTTAFGTAMAFVTSPITLVTAAIAAIIAISALLIANWDEIKEWAISLWDSIKETFSGIKDSIVEAWQNVKDSVSETVENIKEAISEKFDAIKEKMGNVMQAAKDTVSEKLSNMKAAYDSHGGGIKGAVSAAMEGVKGYYSAGFTFVDNLTGGKLSNIANTVKNKMESAKTAVSTAFTNIKTSFTNGLSNALTTVTTKLTSIKEKFSSILESARTTVSNVIERIKGIFNFSWSLPHLKLPHLSISGSFSINPPSVPKFGISWYKKAYENAMILNDPTIFGFSPKSGNLLGGGDGNGGEVVSGADTLMNMIQNAVAVQNEALEYYLQKLVEILGDFFPQVLEAMQREIVLDTGATVGALAVPMDAALGRLAIKKGRGR